MRRLTAIFGCAVVISAMAPAFADDVVGQWLFDTSNFSGDCKIAGRMTFKQTPIKDTYTCFFESEQTCGPQNYVRYIKVEQSCTAQRIGKQVAIKTKVDKIVEVRPKDYPTNYLADNFIVQLSKNLQEMNGQHYDEQRHLHARFWRDEQLVS
jgi:hypothetical protein